MIVHLGSLVGGHMGLEPPKKGRFNDAIAKQALSEINLPYRVALIDNFTGTVRDDEMTGLITMPTIDGRASHGRQSRRANFITWVITTNEPSFSTDIASRVAMIRLAPCDREKRPNWNSEIRAFVKAYAKHIAMDAIEKLKGEKTKVTRHTRFASWDTDVLGCLENPDDVVMRMLEEQMSHDTDTAEITEFLHALRVRHPAPPHSPPVILKSTDLAEVWNTMKSREFTPQQVAQQIKNAGSRGGLTGSDGKPVLEHRKRNGLMVWLWSPWLMKCGEADGEASAERGGQSNTGGGLFGDASPESLGITL